MGKTKDNIYLETGLGFLVLLLLLAVFYVVKEIFALSWEKAVMWFLVVIVISAIAIFVSWFIGAWILRGWRVWNMFDENEEPEKENKRYY